MLGEGVEPAPLQADECRRESAAGPWDVVFYNGLMLRRENGGCAQRKVARAGKPVYAVTEDILDQGGGTTRGSISTRTCGTTCAGMDSGPSVV